jgi:hypothetical protein
MPRPKEERKDEIIAAIRQHLRLVGPRDYDGLMAKYPEMSRATFYRYLKAAREQEEASAAAHGTGALRLAQQRIRSQVEPPDKVQAKIKAHLPTAPSPAVVAADPVNASRAFQFFAFFNQIVGDAELLRGTAVIKNDDGTEKVRNPAMLEKSMRGRLAILDTYLHSVEAVYNMERIRELYDLVIEEVGKASPDIQMAVLARLRELDNRRGLTMNGNV